MSLEQLNKMLLEPLRRLKIGTKAYIQILKVYYLVVVKVHGCARLDFWWFWDGRMTGVSG